MKSAIVLFALVAVAFSEEFYSQEKYQKIDIEAIVNNRVQLKSFITCLTDNNTCDELTGQYKEDFPDLVKNGCARCSPLHKHILRRWMEAVDKEFPEETKVLYNKVDPKNVLIPALKAVIANA